MRKRERERERALVSCVMNQLEKREPEEARDISRDNLIGERERERLRVRTYRNGKGNVGAREFS